MNPKPSKRSKCRVCGESTEHKGHAVVHAASDLASGVYCFACYGVVIASVRHVTIHEPKPQPGVK